MKKILSITLILLLAGSAFAVENPWEKKLPFKSATVTYKVSGTMNGSKTIYVKDYGQTTAEYSNMTMKMFGMTQNQNEVIIRTPDWVYNADLAENTGTRQANINKFLKEEFDKLSGSDKKKVIKNAEAQGISAVEGLNGTVEKKAAKILGYHCDKVTAMGTTAYNISGSTLPLKIQGDTMGIKVNQVATNLSKGKVPSSKFNPPKGIQFAHNPSIDLMMKKQAKTVIENLVAGKPVMAGNTASQMKMEQRRAQQQGASQSSGGSNTDQDTNMDELKKAQEMFKNIFK